jgi:UDP-2,4-diacetamido-2,4,6-trideoxy-beta-L-altropyranose hydrolase
MNIAFRVDASAQIGTGHLMRCLTLADALCRRNAGIRFLSRHMPQHFRDVLASKGYELVDLGAVPATDLPDDLPHAHWLGTTQAEDAAAAIRALSDRIWDWLVVDHYALDIRWESKLRRVARRIVSIDDLANRRHDCDILLDQNFYFDMHARYAGKVPPGCVTLFGPRYALLRQEFQQLRERVKPRTGSVKRVLIGFGGVDADNYTGTAIQAMTDRRTPDIEVDVVVGETHPARERIESECRRLGFEFHAQASRMAELMAAADLAIGAGGTAIWERCCLGLPAIAVCVAENQSRQIADAACKGLIYAPEAQDQLVEFLARHVRALVENSSLRYAISCIGMQMVDGFGASRVVGSMGGSGIQLRQAAPGDSRSIFEWRNHPTVRAASRTADVIDWDCHEKWFAAVLKSPDRLLLVAERAGVAIGVVRFDLKDQEAEISIYLVPDTHPWGEGRELLLTAEGWLVVNRPNVLQIRAYVLGTNRRAQRLFLGAGYGLDSTCYLKRLH